MQSYLPDHDQPIINITGTHVALGPRRRDLVPLYAKWMNDFEVTRTYGARFRTRTLEAAESAYESASKGREDAVQFTIYEHSTMRPIGNAGLEDIDHFDRTAHFVLLIGEKDCWGKGYGTETTMLMLDYGFTLLRLHNIMLTVSSFNERAIRAYARAGFRVMGHRREAHHFNDQRHDNVYMDCLATEFQHSVLRHLLP